VMEWMELLEVVRRTTSSPVWLAFGFLAPCVVNTMGLLSRQVLHARRRCRRAPGARARARARSSASSSPRPAVIGVAGGAARPGARLREPLRSSASRRRLHGRRADGLADARSTF
jgi:hypothetical protein